MMSFYGSRRGGGGAAWLCLPPIVLALLDYTLTLTGQPAAYWAGQYETAEEGNPIARVFLEWNPVAFIALGVAWLMVFSVALMMLPPSGAKAATFLLTFAHAVGASSWLWRLAWLGIILTGGVFLAAERLVDLAWKRASAVGTDDPAENLDGRAETTIPGQR